MNTRHTPARPWPMYRRASAAVATLRIAVAAVIMYRLATFYLPPLWGYVALRWRERNEHL